MSDTDVLVVGAGLAGLHTATLLGGRGHHVTLVDQRSDLAHPIRTTGIFVRKTLDDFTFPDGSLGPPIRRVVLYPPSRARPVELVSDRDEFRVGDMARVYAGATADARAAGVRVRLGVRYLGGTDGRHAMVTPNGPEELRARFVVGADGARSAVARDLGLDRNRRILTGAEEVFRSPSRRRTPTFHCVVDPRMAPGYLAWVVDDGEHVHVGTAGYARRFRHGVRTTLREFLATAPGLPAVPPGAEVERRGGPIPVGGLLRRIASPAGLLVGDAAGAVSPLTAGGLDPCLRLSEHAADVLDDALRTGGPCVLRHYDGDALRRRFRGRLVLRGALDQGRSPALVEAGFAALRTRPGQAAARRILFGDRSFPDAQQFS